MFALERVVEGVQVQKLPLTQLLPSIKVELLPLLRQALELAGGDGVDAYLEKLLAPPGPTANTRAGPT